MWRVSRTGSAAVAVLCLLCSVALPALSQNVRTDALSITPGTRARILGPSADSKYTLITVASTSRDSLRYILLRGLDTKSLSWQQINKMDASIGTHRHFGRGLGIGLLAGAVGGAIFGASIEPGQDFTRGMDAAIGAVWFGFLGGTAGAVIGLAWRSESWIPVNLPHNPVASKPASYGATR
jgi:hypothetical protein